MEETLKLKLITSEDINESLLGIYIKNTDDNNFVLAYKNEDSETVILDKGGTAKNRLVKCSDLKEVLSENLIKGTKFLAGTSNPTLFYLLPGNEENDVLFSSDNKFIPTIPVNSLILDSEINGWKDEDLKPGEAEIVKRSIKVCDDWSDPEGITEEIKDKIDKSLSKIYHYQNFDPAKEVLTGSGYSADVFENSITVNLVSDTTYTDTINLEDWIRIYFNKDTLNNIYTRIYGKLDISFMYSIEGKIHSGMKTIKISSNELGPKIIELEDIQLEYINTVLKIYPLKSEVDEVIINNCVLTIYNG